MMIVIHHHLTTASKPAAKHAKPSSLKYADTTKRKTEREKKKYIYIFIYIFHRKGKQRRRGRRGRRNGGGVTAKPLEGRKGNTRAAKEGEEK